jgi:hypothetical protein
MSQANAEQISAPSEAEVKAIDGGHH